MVPKKALELVDKLIRDICYDENSFFANKLIIFGGDYMQTLPVVKYGTKITVINEIIKCSPVWSNFKVFNLTKNMRNTNKKFASFLLEIGNGSIPYLKIPENWKTDDVCTQVYGNNIELNEDLSDNYSFFP